MCAYPWDAGTMTAGCAKRAFRFGGQQLGGLMNYERNNKLKSYNEVLISSPVYGRNAPESVAAVVFGLMGRRDFRQGAAFAVRTYTLLMARYNLTESDPHPLLLGANWSKPPGKVFYEYSLADAKSLLRAHEKECRNAPNRTDCADSMPSAYQAGKNFRAGAERMEPDERLGESFDEMKESFRVDEPAFEEELARQNAIGPVRLLDTFLDTPSEVGESGEILGEIKPSPSP